MDPQEETIEGESFKHYGGPIDLYQSHRFAVVRKGTPGIKPSVHSPALKGKYPGYPTHAQTEGTYTTPEEAKEVVEDFNAAYSRKKYMVVDLKTGLPLR